MLGRDLVLVVSLSLIGSAAAWGQSGGKDEVAGAYPSPNSFTYVRGSSRFNVNGYWSAYNKSNTSSTTGGSGNSYLMTYSKLTAFGDTYSVMEANVQANIFPNAVNGYMLHSVGFGVDGKGYRNSRTIGNGWVVTDTIDSTTGGGYRISKTPIQGDQHFESIDLQVALLNDRTGTRTRVRKALPVPGYFASFEAAAWAHCRTTLTLASDRVGIAASLYVLPQVNATIEVPMDGTEAAKQVCSLSFSAHGLYANLSVSRRYESGMYRYAPSGSALAYLGPTSLLARYSGPSLPSPYTDVEFLRDSRSLWLYNQ